MVLNKTCLTDVYYIFMKLTLYCRESALAISNWTHIIYRTAIQNMVSVR